MFIPSNYDDYSYLVSYSDNYVVLAKTGFVNASWDNQKTIPVIIQYFNPSIYTLESTQTFSSSRTFNEIDVGSSFYDRSDCPQLITCMIVLIFFLVFILNGITKFVKRGGIFFGN